MGHVIRLALLLGLVEAVAFAGFDLLEAGERSHWLALKGAAIGFAGIAIFAAGGRFLFKEWLKKTDAAPLIALGFLFLPVFWLLLTLIFGVIWTGRMPLWVFIPVAFFSTAVTAELFRNLFHRPWFRERLPASRKNEVLRRPVRLHFGLVIAVSVYETFFGYAQNRLIPRYTVEPKYWTEMGLWFACGAAGVLFGYFVLVLWEKWHGPQEWIGYRAAAVRASPGN